MIKRYASDCIHDAMVLAQQQALNSFSFRDIFNLLNQHWRYCYERMTQLDSGYYSRTVKLTAELTRVPPFVLGTVHVYRAMEQVGFNRIVYSQAGSRDMVSSGTYFISGNDLYCRDAKFFDVWLEYTPRQPTLYFTHHNRDPKILDSYPTVPTTDPKKWRYGQYKLNLVSKGGYNPASHAPVDSDSVRFRGQKFVMQHMATEYASSGDKLEFDVTEAFYRGPTWENTYYDEMYDIVAVFFDFPYAFVSYQHRATGDYSSVVLRDLMGKVHRRKYNAFDYNGRHTNVKFLDAHYNDDTGMGVVVEDYDDINKSTGRPTIKELGFTPDTLIVYPQDCIYDFMVAHMAKRFANKNEASIMDVETAITLAEREMNLFLKKEQNPFQRVVNVTAPKVSSFIR